MCFGLRDGYRERSADYGGCAMYTLYLKHICSLVIYPLDSDSFARRGRSSWNFMIPCTYSSTGLLDGRIR